MFCMECGSKLDAKSKFCANCGTKCTKVPLASEETDPGTEVLACDVEETLSQGAKESLAKLKEKYGFGHVGRKSKLGSKKRNCEIKELLIHVMDKNKKALKRAFPCEEGLTGCVKISTSPGQTTRDWMTSLREHFKGSIEFVPYVMGRSGLQRMNEDATLLELESMKVPKKPLKVYAMAKGKERHEIVGKFNRQKIPKFFDDDHDDLELPSLKVSKSLQSCRTETEEMKECRDDANMPGPSGFGKKSGKSVEQSAKMTTATSTMDVTSNVNLPMCPLKSSSERDDVQTSRMIKRPLEEDTVVPVKSPKTDKSKTCNEDESWRISDDFELPDIEVYPTPSEITDAKANSLSKEDRIEDSPIIDLEVKEFFDLMEMKIKRRKMAEDTVIAFPDKERKVITIIYEDHGGMSFTRPFCKDDTLQSIFTYICKEVEAEILPPVFHLECMAPLKCPTANCKHCWELDASHSLPISSLPDALIIKEGNFLMDDTITNYGNVLL